MVKWQRGEPSEKGFYVVAIEYHSGLGTIGCSYWDGPAKGWSLKDDDIVAYIPVTALLEYADVKWPEPE